MSIGFNLLFITVIILLLIRFRIFIGEHSRLKYKLLQERVNPHFLFNTLHSIQSLMYDDINIANDALLKLADNYRFLISKPSESLIGFEDEWDFLINYLEIENLRYGDSLKVSIKKDGDFSGIKIPPLTLQPLVENCFKHGFSGMWEDGKVEVKAEMKNGHVYIAVSDNGVGLKESDIFSRSLENSRKRLNYYYKQPFIAAKNREEGGTCVEISFAVSAC